MLRQPGAVCGVGCIRKLEGRGTEGGAYGEGGLQADSLLRQLDVTRGLGLGGAGNMLGRAVLFQHATSMRCGLTAVHHRLL